MPWQTPTIEDVRKQNRDFITARLRSGAMVPNSALRVLADGNAGLAFLTLLYIDWLARQFLPDTAEAEWLARHAQIWMIDGAKPATFASGTGTVTGIPGRVVPAGTPLLGGEIRYETTEQIVIGVEETPVAIRALDAGAAGNLGPGDSLSFTTANAGVDAIVSVRVISGGADAETDDELRDRVLERIRNPPMGGDADDYVAWVKEVPGISRAWSFPLEMGIGTVTVRFMCDELRAIENQGFPLESDINTVTEWLNQKRPVAVKDFFVVSPIKQEIEFTIKGLETDDQATRAAIEASVRSMLYDRARPGQTIYRSWVGEAISQAVGEDHHTLYFNDTPMESPGHMAILGSIIYD